MRSTGGCGWKEWAQQITWQFPVLAKYRFAGRGGARPFLEAGPSFRTTGNRNTNPSHTGLTAGAGLDWKQLGFRVAPTFRYTRWAADPWWTHPSKQDQLEALVAISRDGVSDRQPLGGRVQPGIVGGFLLIRPVREQSWHGFVEPRPRVFPLCT
ncbi:MAG: PorT family protein [Acidimicrobiia bacterium]|nr:PorT family protein [Acidimicrobiia bacterium]